MPITFACPSCAASLTVTDTEAGQAGECPYCGGPIVVPVLVEAIVPERSRPPVATLLAEPEQSLPPLPDLRLQRADRRLVFFAWLGGALLVALAVFWVLSGTDNTDRLRYLPDNFQVYMVGNYEEIADTRAYREMVAANQELGKNLAIDQAEQAVIFRLFKHDNTRRFTGGMSFTNPLAPEFIMDVELINPIDLEATQATLKQAGFAESSVAGHTVYRANQGLFPISLCMLGRQRFLYGMNNSLDEVLQRDRPARVTPDMKTIIERLDEEAFGMGMSFQSILEQPIIQRVVDEMEGPGRKMVRDLDMAFLETDFGDDLDITFTVVCKSHQTADELRKLVDGGLALARLNLPQDRPEVARILNEFKLTTEDQELVGHFRITGEDLAAWGKLGNNQPFMGW